MNNPQGILSWKEIIPSILSCLDGFLLPPALATFPRNTPSASASRLDDGMSRACLFPRDFLLSKAFKDHNGCEFSLSSELAVVFLLFWVGARALFVMPKVLDHLPPHSICFQCAPLPCTNIYYTNGILVT